MIRVFDLDAVIRFFGLLGLHEIRRRDSERGRFTLVFLSTGPGEPPWARGTGEVITRRHGSDAPR